MRPVEPRLFRHAGAARGYLTVTAALGIVTTGMVITQAELLARLLAGAARTGRSRAGSASRLPLVYGVAMGIGAMTMVMLRLPLTSVLLATLLLSSEACKSCRW